MKNLHYIGDVEDFMEHGEDIEEKLLMDSRLIILEDCYVLTTVEELELVNSDYPVEKNMDFKAWLLDIGEWILEELFYDYESQISEVEKICEKVVKQIESMVIDEFKNCDLINIYYECAKCHLQEENDQQSLNNFNNDADEIIIFRGGHKLKENQYFIYSDALGEINITLESESHGFYHILVKLMDISKSIEHIELFPGCVAEFKEYYPRLCLNLLESFLDRYVAVHA